MPPFYYRRRWKPRWRRGYRRFWPWRTRKTLRRRHRRKRRVRRKLPFLTLKQWQPPHINKLCVKGLFCLLQAHKTRYNHNYNQYQASIPAEGLPNGGGFSLIRFTLQALFEEHELAHNVWTKSNRNLPLFRYTGGIIKVYRPENIDLIVKFQYCYPMCCSKLLYTGSQPSIMMMSKGSKLIRCRKSMPNSKPYKKFKVRVPSQMQNKWYFQHTESSTGLLMIQASSASFDNYYTSSEAESSTITLYSLNTRIFQNMNFATTPTYGYIPKTGYTFWASNGDEKLKNLVWLGNSQIYQQGKKISDLGTTETTTQFKQTLQTYMQDSKNWGNIFVEDYLHKKWTIWRGTQPPLQQFASTTHNYTGNTTPQEAGLQKTTEELIITVRYNPFRDKGYNNNIYIIANYTDNNDDLTPPEDIDIQNPGFPNWLSCFGFQDYLIKLGKKSKINEHWIMVWKSLYFEPQLPFYIFLDKWFLHGDSEELIGRTGWDAIHWYPQIQHQQGALNSLALCGPGAPKLGKTTLAEAKIEYRFYFKVGGCGGPTEKITNPSAQPTYATPTNILEQHSLQSPEEPIETFLYQFDWRRGQITETAAKRITQDHSLRKHLFSDTETTGTAVPLQQTHEKDLLSSEEEETQKETLFQQLLNQRLKQKQLRLRIKQLMSTIQQLE